MTTTKVKQSTETGSWNAQCRCNHRNPRAEKGRLRAEARVAGSGSVSQLLPQVMTSSAPPRSKPPHYISTGSNWSAQVWRGLP